MSLRQDHKILYDSVCLKAIVFFLSGLALIFGRIPPNSSSELALRALLFNLQFWAVAFLSVGIGIIVGTYISWRNYFLTKAFLAIGMFVASMWILALLWTVVKASRSPTTFFMLVIIFWGYFTYHLFHLISDRGWVEVGLKNG